MKSLSNLRKRVNQLVTCAAIALTVAAVVQQLRRPREERTWHGSVLGVPYDFRRPSLERFKARWWNPEDPRLFTPRDFGVGWAINLHRAYTLATEKRRSS